MIRVRVLVVAVLLAALSLPSAQAQGFGHRPPPRGGAAPIDCDVIAANPGAGMDKASCEAMVRAQQSYQNAQSDPAAAHPGDAAMTCDDIKAEFMREPMAPPPREHVAEAQAAAGDYMAKQAQMQAEVAAQTAALSGAAMAASAASMANPIAGRAADQAVDRAAQATEAADNAQARAELTPRARRLTAGTGVVVGDMTTQLDANPRLARLVALANEKHCHGW